jgi:hypothetical protein
MTSRPRFTRLTIAGLVGLAACAGGTGDSGPTAIKAPTSARFAIGDVSTDPTPELGKLKVCKSSSSNVAGTFAISRVQVPAGVPASGSALTSATVQPNSCVVVAEDNGDGVASDVTVDETSAGFQNATIQLIHANLGGGVTTDSPAAIGDPSTTEINSFHGATIIYVNTVDIPPPPPPPVCDFITFGRLIVSVNGQKVVISGNAGGNQPGGGILSEFHIEANGVDNHVAQVDTYGAITSSGPLFGLTNSRITTGTAKNGVAVELRLWDGGEPGKGTDKVYVKLDGVELFGPDGVYIDQGNMQFHSNCRGPKL